MLTVPTQVRLAPKQLDGLLRATKFAVQKWNDFHAMRGCGKLLKPSAADFDELEKVLEKHREAKTFLPWNRVEGSSTSHTAMLGGPEDGVTFELMFYPSCYRRGPWRLHVVVHGGRYHHHWGCFDDADQPLRNYHDMTCAVLEADAIAKVLLKDRLRTGTIRDWTPTPTQKAWLQEFVGLKI